MKARVFLPQEPVKRGSVDNGDGTFTKVWVPSFDTRALLDYGNPVVCLPPGRMLLSTAPTVMTMSEKLRDFCDDDYIVGIGDPALIGITCALAAANNRGRFKMLKWDKDRKGYIEVAVNLYQRLGGE